MNLYNGDCLEILKDISSNSVDLVICDLPFGCLAGGYRETGTHPQSTNPNQNPNQTHFTTQPCSWDIKIDLEAFWKEIRRIRRNDHTPCLHFCTTKYGFDLWESNKKEFRYDLVWAKPNAVGFLSANKMPMRSHEMIYVFSKSGANYERIDISGDFPQSYATRSEGQQVYGNISMPETKPNNKGKRCVKSVIDCSNRKTKGGHPTAKPVELYKFLIQRYCPAGGTVLDPTFGSGNSGLAAVELGRKYIGIEKDKTFFEKAKKKLCPE